MNQQIDMKNNELKREYQNYMNTLIKKGLCHENLSVPMTIKLHEKYYDPNIPTIMVLGQETNHFGDEFKLFNQVTVENMEAVIKDLLGNYEWRLCEYLNSYEADTAPFFRFLKELKKRLNNEFNMVWDNLYRHSYFNDEEGVRLYGKIDPKLYDALLLEQKQLLHAEIDIIKPDYLVFLTGHGLDHGIENILDVSVTKEKIFRDGSVELKLEGSLSNIPTLRTYHPGYLNRKSQQFEDVLNWIVNTIRKKERDHYGMVFTQS